MNAGRVSAFFALMIPVVATWPAVEAAPTGSAQWIADTTGMLENGTASEQQAARTELIRAAESKGTTASYPASLTAAVLPILRGSNSRAKLNAAVALERVADKTANPSLLPAVSVLLDDRCDAVALWGVKSAHPLIAAGGATASTLAVHIVVTVKAHPDCGPIAEEAYAALITEPMQPALVDPLLDLLNARTADYGAGAVPPSPMAEQSVPVFVSTFCWEQATAAGRIRILTGLAKFTLATAGAIADGSTDRAVLLMLHRYATGLEAIGMQLPNAGPLTAAARSLEKVQLDDAASISADCKDLTSALANLGIQLEPSRRPRTVPRP